MNTVLGGEGHIGSYIRRNLEKLHGQESGEDQHNYPFPLTFNILCVSCYHRKMIRSYLLWREKGL